MPLQYQHRERAAAANLHVVGMGPDGDHVERFGKGGPRSGFVAAIRAIAKHADQPLSHVCLGNLMYDACQMGGIYGAVGCSSYSCNIDGRPTLVRNMDWVWPKSTGRHTRLVRFHRGRESYTSVSVLGCVGVVSAICPGKWAVTMNQAPMEGATSSYYQWPVLQRLRRVCDKMGSFNGVSAG